MAIAACASRTWAFDSANFRPPLRPRGLESGQGAFTDQLPVKLGLRREDAEHEAAGRRGGVDLRALTGEHPQTHAAGGEVLHGVDEMGEVAAETVEFPDHEHVALPQGAQAAVESRPVVAYAGSDVVVEVGRIVDAFGPQGTRTLVVNGETVAGAVRTLGGTYRIRTVGSGLYAINEEPPLDCEVLEPEAEGAGLKHPFH